MVGTVTLYDRNSTGNAQAVHTCPRGQERVILQAASITQLRQKLGSVKTELGIRNAPVEVKVGTAYTNDNAPAAFALPVFDVNERFSMMADIVDTLIEGDVNSVVIAGRGGTGKSHTAYTQLAAAGYTAVTPVTPDEGEDEAAYPVAASYVLIKGGMSATELFKVLFFNRNKTIVFDDADSCMESETTCNLLKAVLDTYEVRTVTWLSPFLANQGIPSTFTFEGQIIFISNKKLSAIPQAIRSRSLVIDLDMTNAELVDRVRAISPILLSNLSAEQRELLVDYIDQYKDQVKELTIRSFQNAAPFMKRANWKSLVLFSL